MQDAEIQNWLNHARGIGYSDAEIRGLMLKAGWSIAQVNHAMVARGLTPGSASKNRTGKVVPRRLERHSSELVRHYLTILVLITICIVVWVVAYWVWQR